MPFTLAHPAAALPLRRPLGRWAAPVALVVGSMVPDFGYFLPWVAGRLASHTPWGLLTFNLPVGLVAFAAFHLLAPASLRARLPRASRSRVPLGVLIFTVPVSIVLGAATHLAWDSCTHDYGVAVAAFSVLSTPIFTWEGYTLFVYRVLQHLSTFAGLALLGRWARDWWREQSPAPLEDPHRHHGRVFLSLLLVPPFLAAMRAGWQHHAEAEGILGQLQVFLGRAIFTGGSVGLPWLLVLCLFWRILLRAKGHRAAP